MCLEEKLTAKSLVMLELNKELHETIEDLRDAESDEEDLYHQYQSASAKVRSTLEVIGIYEARLKKQKISIDILQKVLNKCYNVVK